MFYRGISIWPPLWLEQEGEIRIQSDESGVLVDVREALDCDKSYLYTRYDNKTYIGCLLFENTDSCKSVTALLKRNIGKRIKVIGDTEILGRV